MATRLTLPEVVARFAAYYEEPGNGAWGSLHIVLDDGNVGDDCVLFCKQWALDRDDHEGAALADILLTLTKAQRGRLNRKVHEWIKGQEQQRKACLAEMTIRERVGIARYVRYVNEVTSKE